MVNAMIVCSGLLYSFSGKALMSACFILNRVPTKKMKETPYKLWFKRRPNLNRPNVWRCLAYLNLIMENQGI